MDYKSYLPTVKRSVSVVRPELFISLACVNLLTGGCSGSNDLPVQPNILFAISDDQSFPHTSAYGCKWVSTPAFDRVAADGILFTNCYTPNAKSAPSRSTIITGRYSWQLEEAGNHVSFFPDKFKSFCEVFMNDTEYHTGFTGKGVEPVVVKNRLLTGKPWQEIRVTPPGRFISNIDYSANFSKFLENKPEGKPFFFWYGCQEPHRAYQYGIGTEKGGKSVSQIDKIPGFWPENDTVRTDMLDYAFEIEYFDSHLAKMIHLLEEKGELDNTIIVVTADNGMPFPRCKGIEYEYSNHMPLAIMWPKGIKNPGRTVKDFVSFVDFAPTFLELAGVTDPEKAGMQKIEGKSLIPIFTSGKDGQVIPERSYTLLGQERHDVGRPDDVGYPVRSIIQDGFLYIHNFEPGRWPMCNPETGYLNSDGSPTKTLILNMRRRNENTHFWNLCFAKKGSEELYKISEDPECLNNLIEKAEFKDLASRMKSQLFEELKSQGDPRMEGKGYLFDQYPYAEERVRNFYNRYMKGEIKTFVTNWIEKTDFEPAPIEN